MFDLEDCIAFITCKCAKDLASKLEKRLTLYNITRVQWIAMYYIDLNDTITQKQLADKMSLREPTVARLLDRMEKEEFICRVNTGQDKRVNHLELTAKGREIRNSTTLVAEQFKDDAIRNISDEELLVYKDVLAKMVANTEER